MKLFQVQYGAKYEIYTEKHGQLVLAKQGTEERTSLYDREDIVLDAVTMQNMSLSTRRPVSSHATQKFIAEQLGIHINLVKEAYHHNKVVFCRTGVKSQNKYYKLVSADKVSMV